jgi:hypothetical protein
MGLDMYLGKRTYIKNWNHMTPEERHQVTVTRNGKPTHIQPGRVAYIIEEVGYWRKANAIHKWFVDNVQGGIDDCGEYRVSRTQLEELLGRVEAVLADHAKAPELLPTADGFFFGSTEYDDSYFQDLDDTKEMIVRLLREPKDGTIYYHSSW